MVDRRELSRAVHGDRILLFVGLLFGDLFASPGGSSWLLGTIPEREVLEAHLGRLKVPDRVVACMVQGEAPRAEATFAEKAGQRETAVNGGTMARQALKILELLTTELTLVARK